MFLKKIFISTDNKQKKTIWNRCKLEKKINKKNQSINQKRIHYQKLFIYTPHHTHTGQFANFICNERTNILNNLII